MVSRAHVLEALIHEINVCKHLFGKIPEGGLEFRFTEKQRSTDQVLRYLLTCGIGAMESLVHGDWSYYDNRDKEVEGVSIDQFPALMEKQGEYLREVMEQISDDDLMNKIVDAPGVAEPLPLGAAIMRTSYAWLLAYRMQLFLQVKASGASQLNTANNWSGVDWRPKEKVSETEGVETA